MQATVQHHPDTSPRLSQTSVLAVAQPGPQIAEDKKSSIRTSQSADCQYLLLRINWGWIGLESYYLKGGVVDVGFCVLVLGSTSVFLR